MGWSIGYDDNWRRDIGYGVPAICDHPKCSERIDRGLFYVCGGDPYGDPYGCGLYFCSKHLRYHTFIGGETHQVCNRCDHHKKPYRPKPDTQEWIDFKMTDPSWEEWREASGKTEVEK